MNAQDLVAAYLAAGGKVRRVPPGVAYGFNPSKPVPAPAVVRKS